MEPTKTEIADMKTIQHVFAWAGVEGDFATALADALGIQPAEPVRVLAAISEEDMNDTKSSMTIGGTKPSPAQKGKMALAWKTARIAAGVQLSAEATAEKAAAEMKREADKMEIIRASGYEGGTPIAGSNDLRLPSAAGRLPSRRSKT